MPADVSGVSGLIGKVSRRLFKGPERPGAEHKPTARYPRESVPASEIEATARLIRSHPEYFALDELEQTYRSLGLNALADPFGRDVSDLAAQALASAAPLSVVRLGDGEMNVLSFGAYDTPCIDRFSVACQLGRIADFFVPDELAFLQLREMMLAAVLQADVVGVRGVGNPWKGTEQADAFADRFTDDLRGLLGVCWAATTSFGSRAQVSNIGLWPRPIFILVSSSIST